MEEKEQRSNMLTELGKESGTQFTFKAASGRPVTVNENRRWCCFLFFVFLPYSAKRKGRGKGKEGEIRQKRQIQRMHTRETLKK